MSKMQSVSRLALIAAALAAPLAAAPALAQDAPAAQGEQTPEDILVTAQRQNRTEVTRGGNLGALGNQDAVDTPFSIRSYNEALILNQQPLTLGQLLENDPTVRTTYGFGNAAEQFVIRGLSLAGDDVGLNGLYGIAPRQLIAPELYDSVQVLNGSNAFLYGAAPGGSGLGGSVNLMFKRADRDLLRLTGGYISTAHAGGSFDLAQRSGDGSFGVRINGAFRSGDVSVDDEFRRTAVIAAALNYSRGPLRISLDLAYQRIEVEQLRPKVTIGSAAVPAVPDADANYAQPFAYTDLRDIFGIARAEYDVSPGVMLYAAFGARDGSEEGIYDSITVTNAATGAATGSDLYVPRTDNNEAAEAGVRAHFDTGSVTHQLNVGGSINWQTNRNAYDFLGGFVPYGTNLYAPVVVPQPGTGFVGGNLADPFPVARTRFGSLFASDTIGVLDDRILFTAGLRLQQINVRGNSYADGSLSSEYDESKATPVFGLVVKPTGRLSLYANYIEGLVQGATAPVDPTLINSGEVFAPSATTQYEVGARYGSSRFNASVALFQIERPSAFAIPDPAGSGRNVFGQFGTQRNRGIELTADGAIGEGLRVIGGFTVLDAKFTETAGGVNEGNQAPGVPDYLANLNVEWDLPFARGLTLTGRVVHTGPQQVNNTNTLEISDWTRFDLGARYVAVIADKPVTFRGGVDNVANERYWASAFDVFSPQLLQGAPRTFRLSVSVDM